MEIKKSYEIYMKYQHLFSEDLIKWNVKKWVSFDSAITEINELKGLIKSYKASSENWKKKYNEAISKVKKWEHNDLSKDWVELVNKLFKAPDLNSRSSDGESKENKGSDD